jgi:hypothetical protein
MMMKKRAKTNLGVTRTESEILQLQSHGKHQGQHGLSPTRGTRAVAAASLGSLPAELHLRILHCVPPEDLVAACLALCRRADSRALLDTAARRSRGLADAGQLPIPQDAAEAGSAVAVVRALVHGVVLGHMDHLHMQPGESKEEALVRCTVSFVSEFSADTLELRQARTASGSPLAPPHDATPRGPHGRSPSAIHGTHARVAPPAVVRRTAGRW